MSGNHPRNSLDLLCVPLQVRTNILDVNTGTIVCDEGKLVHWDGVMTFSGQLHGRAT